MAAIDRNDLLAATRTAFTRAFTDALDEVIKASISGLFHKADIAPSLPEQSRLLDARAVLMSKDVALKRHLISEMEHLLNRSFQTAYSTFRPSFYDSIGTSSLSLIDTSVFEGGLHIEETTKFLRDKAEDQWRDLNIRIAILFEQDDINERENPFRAYLFARCIANAIEKLETPSDLIDPLAVQLAESLSVYVLPIYKQLNELLANHGIAAQLHLKIKKTPQNQTRSQSAPGEASENAAPQSSGAAESATNSSNALREEVAPLAPVPARKGKIDRLFDWITGKGDTDVATSSQSEAGEVAMPHQTHTNVASVGAAPASQVRAATGVNTSQDGEVGRSWLGGAQAVGEVLRNFFSPAAPVSRMNQSEDGYAFEPDENIGLMSSTQLSQSVQTFQQLNTPSAAAMVDDSGRVRNLILEHRDELSKMSSNTNEQMIIDIVAMLFEFILRDGHVPAEVRAQLGRLQFLVLKVALLDPELFTHKSHPARMLVNRIGTIVLDLQVLDPGGARVTTEICRIVEILLADESEEITIFSKMLDEFDAFVAHELRTADHQVERTVQVMENAESRTLQFARISSLISEGLTHLKVDEYLHDFLVNTWSRVIERVERDSSADVQKYREFVPKLIWSIIPKVLEAERKQLFGMIPLLLDTLREGLGKIAWSETQQQKVFDWLVDSHRHALRASAHPEQLPPFDYVASIFESFIGARHIAPVEKQVIDVLDSTLLDEAIKELELEVNMLDKMFDLEIGQVGDACEHEHDPVDTFEHWDDEAEDVSEGAVNVDADIQERLRSGVVIEIRLEETPTRAKLNWISSNASNIVLSLEGVSTPSVISIKVFKRLMKTGRVRFLELEPLFERAVKALLESADQLDKHSVA